MSDSRCLIRLQQQLPLHSLFAVVARDVGRQWEHFLLNLGCWQGRFDTLDRDRHLQRRQPSQLTLARAGEAIDLELLFWPDQVLSDPLPSDQQPINQQPINQQPFQGEPVKRIVQTFRHVDPELGFFSTGSFSRGSLQIGLWLRPYAEFGFICGDRRHRLVLLWDGAGRFDHSVLIRECRAGCIQQEAPALTPEALVGAWSGEETVLERQGSPESALPSPCQLVWSTQSLQRITWLPDGGGYRVPERVSPEQPFAIEAWWMPAIDQVECLQRSYDEKGGWQSTRHLLLRR